jgi:hypothetical protein
MFNFRIIEKYAVRHPVITTQELLKWHKKYATRAELAK